MVWIFRLFFAGFAGWGGYELGDFLQKTYLHLSGVYWSWVVPTVGLVVFALVGFLLGGVLGRRAHMALVRVEEITGVLPGTEVLVLFIGFITGVLLSLLVSIPIIFIPYVGKYLAIFIMVVFAYAGMRLARRNRERVLSLMKYRERASQASRAGGVSPKVIDTSTLVDGRIADICETGFVEGEILIPAFVLNELRTIADSSDQLRRNRGRAGLDVAKRLQESRHVKTSILSDDFPSLASVDEKLIMLAKSRKASIITNDFNLNKIAALQGIKVLNVNDLANALKAVVLPGEKLSVTIIKEGKEAEQGVGYLDDGTMVVVEQGRKFIGSKVEVSVTGVLQTPAGRMVFSKLEEDGEGG